MAISAEYVVEDPTGFSQDRLRYDDNN